MQIVISTDLPQGYQADLTCRFYEDGAGYASPKRADKTYAPRAGRETHLRATPIGLVQEINLSGYQNYERDEARRIAGSAGLRQLGSANGTQLCWLLDGDAGVERFTQLMEGALLFAYRFERYRSQDDAKPKAPQPKLTVVAGPNAPRFKKTLKRLNIVMGGVSLARDLANIPAADLVPEQLASEAAAMAKAHGLGFTMLNAARLAREGYVGLTAVGGGSAHPPVMFALKYQPSKPVRRSQALCLVGKGITFDSGGLCIKPTEGMWAMKADMHGAATVIGAMQAIAELQLPVTVTAVVAAAENMPDGLAYRPGDVLRYKNGRTAEIISTDAEGRMILADALLYAQRSLKQKRLVEFSTLTGSCLRALGLQYIGLMSRYPDLAARVTQAAEGSGDAVWELPLHPEYRLLLKSTIADMKHTGGPNAGAQTAGWFLHEFIDEGTEYVHLDIAGTFLTEKEDKYWGQAGATGTGVRLAVRLAEQWA